MPSLDTHKLLERQHPHHPAGGTLRGSDGPDRAVSGYTYNTSIGGTPAIVVYV